MQKIILNEDMAYFVGVIIGDGHISNASKSKKDKSKDYRIVIDISSKEYIFYLETLIKKFIKTKSKPRKSIRKENRKQRYYLQIRNKNLYKFLTNYIGIQKGPKSSFVQIPKKILCGSTEFKKHFLAGLFDTDGGFRGDSLGFTTASKILREQTYQLLNEMGIICSKDQWVNKKYKKEYFGIRISKKKIVNFLKAVKLRNVEKAKRIISRFDYAEVPEWPNGTENLSI